MNDDLLDTITINSDQLNADNLVGGPITVTIKDVIRNKSKDQPVSIVIDGGHQPYKPNLTWRKMLIAGWGPHGKRDWPGRKLTLFRNPNVKWGGKCVGGIEISHMSHIERDFELSLSVTRGKKAAYKVQKLANESKDIDQQWVNYCKNDLSKLKEIPHPAYRAKIKAMIDA